MRWQNPLRCRVWHVNAWPWSSHRFLAMQLTSVTLNFQKLPHQNFCAVAGHLMTVPAACTTERYLLLQAQEQADSLCKNPGELLTIFKNGWSRLTTNFVSSETSKHIYKMATLQAIKYSRGKLLVLDQLRLPHENHYDEVSTAEEAFDCIRSMRVRGAPAIAIVAALAHAVELHNGDCTATEPEEVIAHIEKRLDYLKESRPTAVDLSNAITLLKLATRAANLEGLAHPEAKEAILNTYIQTAEEILAKDLHNNTSIGSHGAAWLQQQYNASSEKPISVLTHCNTGSLATSGHGTALGIIRTLHSEGLLKHAYCTETRPYNQGSRLTSFELVFEGIPSTLITDSMAGALFNLHRERMNIGAVIVGADRVVRNGDTANKIGTYQLAVLARHHGVKFVVAAPTTSIDLETENGSAIEIEERKREELTQISGAIVNEDGTVDTSKTARVAIADQRIGVWNPAFDVTPHELIDAIVTERGTVVKGADGKFDFSQVLPERLASVAARQL
ncbi:S-methyl-5-thioribose-1-phosphate isomerase [Podospora pseudoanserina]|uniref:Methylthioribose-1-phosphate isomerase n=1 Tax=Podospora pseudoanserina TaxID=2609844 RepID=A0ABR0I5H2_9PEZI|nr:S-methyl-5-thioribose-1-phosphate isomerase [Podospora pseudoanserina]